MFLQQIYDPYLSQYAYLIGCQKTGEALIIDPERDIDRYRNLAAKHDLRITGVAETHIHADFLSGTREFVSSCEPVIGYLSSEGGEDWQYEWVKGHDKVVLLKDGDSFSIGRVEISVLHLPGHTPEHICFLVTDKGGGADEPFALVSGDFLFVGDVGRPDLLETAAGEAESQGPAARNLFRSILKIEDIPDFVHVLPGHGAGSSCGKALGSIPFSSIGYEKRFNSAVKIALCEGEAPFVSHILEGQPEPPMYFARMKQTNRDGAPVLGTLPEPRKLSVEEVAYLVGSDADDFVVLETKGDREAFLASHLSGSLFAPFGPKFSEAAGSYVHEGTRIYLLMEDEEHLDDCVRQLVRIGLDQVAGYALHSEVDDSEVCRPYFRSTKVIGTSEIDPDETILDVRSAGEHADAHVPGAIHVPHTRVVADKHELPEDTTVTVHCGSGVRASLVGAVLERAGYDVTVANGMFSDWVEQAETVGGAKG